MESNPVKEESSSFTPTDQLPVVGAPQMTGIARRSLRSRLGDDVAGIAGRYRMKSQISRTSSSVIYNAHDEDLGREVAIKVVPAAHANEPDLRHRLSREAHIAAMLDHPNIVPVYDLDLGSDGRLYFTMRLITGRSLAMALSGVVGNEGRIDTLQAQLAVVCGVADALGYAHKHSVVHSDVTSANIMIGQFGEVILVDWGSATLIEGASGAISDVAAVSTVAADPRYQSPEQARGEPATPASDQYALAAIAFHLLLGRPPLCLPSNPALEAQFAERKRRGDIDEPDAREQAKVSKPVLAALRKALSPSPSARFANMAEFSAALEPFMSSSPAAAQRLAATALHNVVTIILVVWMLFVGVMVMWSMGLFKT